MRNVEEMLERQAEWQKRRASLSWPEKVRMVEAVQESIRQLRARARREATSPHCEIDPANE
jgi:hypothetical protein